MGSYVENNSAFCDYCDFYSEDINNYNEDIIDTFLSALLTDIKTQIDFFNIDKISTAYIGGGTPSVLGAHRIGSFLDELVKIKCFTPREFTIEANPETADADFMRACAEGGITRLSLGAQSFYEPSRKAVNRNGSLKSMEESLSAAAVFFPQTFSADLLCGLPFQTEEIIADDIKRLLEYNPSHVSLYSLILEEGTVLENNVKTGKIPVPDTDTADILWLAGKETLENAGYEHYEVSNFSLSGKRCLHNIRYWLMDNWLGAGPAASGTIVDEDTGTARRFTFAPDAAAYIKNPSIENADCENIGRHTLIRESLLMGYRYIEGPDSLKFRSRFGVTIENCIGRTLDIWKGKDKMLFLNRFLKDAFNELESLEPIARQFP